MIVTQITAETRTHTHTAGRMVSRSAYFAPDGPTRETHGDLGDNVYWRST